MARIKASQALGRFRVLDFSRVRAGPTCVRMLADFGADVLRIEPPGAVDPNAGMFAERHGGDFQNLNRNKRSLTLNLKSPGAREVVERLVKEADVVVENWRPGVKKKLGLDYESLRRLNPRIILASISGYGQGGPYANRPAFDQIIQGLGGFMSVTGLPGQGPVRAGIAVSDSSAGLYAALGIFVALLEREQSGEGQWVQASLLHSMIAMMDFQMARYLIDGEVPTQEGNHHPTTCPMGLFQASDGAFNIGVAGEGMWRTFCAVLERSDWVQDPDYADAGLRSRNRARLNAEIQKVFSTRTAAHWVDLLNKAGVPSGRVYSVPEVFEDEQVKYLQVETPAPMDDGTIARYLTQPVVLSRTPATVVRGGPAMGEHTGEILREAGFTDADVARLRQEGVV